ncbi:RrF2 family transcriptional regulator [Allopusillimonas ginsengisoli]|uniref:RrF2 family transcriptional regulator n=1 Tax=Allopusillimonas ginsengisoli TaxID=453575 RepID=UPI00101EE57C|nr:Rrf2 family transcriptional regulator [Allopusillimonas ginsengisoli]TEA69457.1 Rrf2 family transcriptional regulator [Allopusillimonas ginsengisoli]
MRRDSKLSSILHVLLHMTHSEGPLTSEELARYLVTNPVLVRRVLAGLRKRGYVSSDKGHGGGWTITCDLHKVTLYDIYEAVGSPTMFAMGNRVDHPECLVEQVVNQSLASAFDEAEALLVNRFRDVTLADLAERFNHQYAKHRRGKHEHQLPCK